MVLHVFDFLVAELIFGDSLPLKSGVYLVLILVIVGFVNVVIQVSQQITTAVPHTIDVSVVR